MSNKWLENLRVGDDVVVAGEYKALTKVERTTKTQIIAGDSKFRKSDGYTVGNRGFKLIQVTDEIVTEIKNDDLRLTVISKINSKNWHNEKIEAIKKLADAMDIEYDF